MRRTVRVASLAADPRPALAAVGELADAEIDLADAALQLARVDAPDADWVAARDYLSELARDAAALTDSRDVSDQAAALAGLLTGRHGYAGDTEHYDDPANANLIRVIERRRGLPVALGILWLHAATAAGWNAAGIDFPGHFLVALDSGGMQVVLDPYTGGRSLDARDLRLLLRRVAGPRAELAPGMLQAMGNRAVLLRLQNNIRVRRAQAGDLTGALACAETMLLVAPEAAELWRETASLHQQLDQMTAALHCLGRFVALSPDGDGARMAREMMDELRSRLN